MAGRVIETALPRVLRSMDGAGGERVAPRLVRCGASRASATARPRSRTAAEAAPLLAGWSLADRAVGLYLTWMLVLWLAMPRSAAWPWLLADGAALAYLLGLGGTRGRIWASCRERLRPLAQLGHSLLVLWVLLALAYEQAGRFGTAFMPSIEGVLIRADRIFFGLNWYTRQPHAPSLAGRIFEGAYLFNYPLIFGGTSLLLLAAAWMGMRRRASPRREALERLSQSVLAGLMLSLLGCYALFPLLPAITPRLYFAALHQPPGDALRAANAWLLAREAVPWGIFPSGHVAGPMAMGGVFLAFRRHRIAAFYIAAALVIAVATVYGNYHFVCDAIGGALMGVLAAAVVARVMRRVAPATAALEDVEETLAA